MALISLILGVCLIGAACMLNLKQRELPSLQVEPDEAPARRTPGWRHTGDIGSSVKGDFPPDSKEADAAYGPLNESALHEEKEGILRNIVCRSRARRSYRSSQWTQCQPVPQQPSQPSYPYVRPLYPSTRPADGLVPKPIVISQQTLPATVSQPSPVRIESPPVSQADCPMCREAESGLEAYRKVIQHAN